MTTFSIHSSLDLFTISHNWLMKNQVSFSRLSLIFFILPMLSYQGCHVVVFYLTHVILSRLSQNFYILPMLSYQVCHIIFISYPCYLIKAVTEFFISYSCYLIKTVTEFLYLTHVILSRLSQNFLYLTHVILSRLSHNFYILPMLSYQGCHIIFISYPCYLIKAVT